MIDSQDEIVTLNNLSVVVSHLSSKKDDKDFKWLIATGRVLKSEFNSLKKC